MQLHCYYAVHESVVMGDSLVRHIPSKKNVSELMTKALYGHERIYLVSNILYDSHEDHKLLALRVTKCIIANLIPLVTVSILRRLDQCIHG